MIISTYECEVLVGNNQPAEVTGKVRINISIGKHVFQVDCTVLKSLSNPLILGWIGFIKEYERVKTGSITIKSSSHHVKDFAFWPEDILLDAYTETTTLKEMHETTAANIAFIERYKPLFQ